MSMSIKTAIITGGSKGIGAAVSSYLAAQGVAVIVNYASDKDPAEELVTRIKETGGRAHALCADVSDAIAFKRLFDEAEALIGPVGLLVNNAGTMTPMRIADASDDFFNKMFALNVQGTFNGCRLAATRLVDGGAIVNISSSVVGMSPPGYGLYCATKAAIEAITRSLSKELGIRRIRVNAVAPGPTDTELLSNANSEERLQGYRDATPLGRLGAPDDIAGVIAFLAQPTSGWINGQTIRVNGGIVA